MLDGSKSSIEDFYPRSPCGERLQNAGANLHILKFLSTLSLRRATRALATYWTRTGYFYPRSPCGERHTHPVSIHVRVVFLSTLSLRRATSAADSSSVCSSNFYPRSPCGERLLWVLRKVPIIGIFLSTLSLRRATVGVAQGADYWHISIHALLAESDSSIEEVSKYVVISIHALLAESDLGNAVVELPTWKFLSTLSLRRATIGTLRTVSVRNTFLSTLSLRRATCYR